MAKKHKNKTTDSTIISDLKRLIGYIGKYNVAIIIAILLLIFGVVISVFAPKILGRATTSLGNSVVNKKIYEQVQETLKVMPKEAIQNIPTDATIKTLIEYKVIPEEVSSKLPDSAKDIKIFGEEPKIDFGYIRNILLIVLAIYLVNEVMQFIANRIMAYISQKVTYNLRKQLSEKLDRLPLKFYDNNTQGEILSKITNDVDNISSMLQQSLVEILQSVFTIIGILIIMFTINIPLAFIAAIVLPLSLLMVKIVVGHSQKYFKEQQEVLGKLNGHIEEVYTGHEMVKAFNKESYELKKMKDLNDGLYNSSWKSQFLSGLMMPTIITISNLSYVGICIYGAKLTISGSLSIGDIQAFLQYINQFTQPISQTANMLNIMQSTMASAKRIFDLLDEPEETHYEQIDEVNKVQGKVSFENVNFSYNDNIELIKDLNLDIKPGQMVAIVGPTGAGKTTITNLLLKFYEINSGDIKVDDKSIKDMSREEVRKMFGVVLQDTWLFNGTITENMRYAKTDATDEEIKEAIKLAQSEHFVSLLQDQYDFKLSEGASNISQGQKQLLTIARAILSDLPMLILDEATSNVDTKTEKLIQKAMDELINKKTTFVIAHRLSTIKKADLILVIDDGKIVEQGTHEELLLKEGNYFKLYNSQFNEAE